MYFKGEGKDLSMERKNMKQIKNWLLGMALAVMLTATASAADLQKGIDAYWDEDYAAAIAEFTPLAEAGDAEAQYWLGYMYANGEGVEEDEAESAKWYSLALEGYRRAAKAGDAEAQNSLGWMYERGHGVEQNEAEAAKWYRLAIEGYRRAAEAGDIESQNTLGLKYVNGDGVAQDDAEALKWFRRAAEAGHIDAQHNLGVMYHYGRGVGQNFEEAAEWYRRAAESGHADAQNNLGSMYVEGRGIPQIQDNRLAYMWFSLAADQGNELAPRNLENVKNSMTPEQIIEAKEMAKKCHAQNYKNCGGETTP